MIIDFHCHAFAKKIAEKAVTFLENYYGIMAEKRRGDLKDALTIETTAGVDYFVLLVAATKPEQVIPANNWVVDVKKLGANELSLLSGLPRTAQPIIFGTIHPYYKDNQNELQRLRAEGIKGIKIHPEFQGFGLDDPKMYPLYEAFGEDLILLTHVGDKNPHPDNPSTPLKLKKVLLNFPRLRVVAAHLGGYHFWNDALTELAGRDLYFDLSSTLKYIDPVLLKEIINRHGTEKLLFGSDYPIGDPAAELQLLEEMSIFTSSQFEAVAGLNAQRLLGIG